MADGPHTITATQTDAAGITSPPSIPVTFTVDTSGPPAPAITAPTNGSTTNDNTPTITGTGRPSDTIAVSENGSVVCTTSVTSGGTWSCVPATPVPDGTRTLTPTATDQFGSSAEGVPVTLIVDTVPPAPPTDVVAELGPGTDVTISGRAEPGATVTVTDGGGAVVCTAQAAADGTWSCSGPVGSGPLTAVAADSAGNVSGPTLIPVADLLVSVTLPSDLATPGPAVAVIANGGPSPATGVVLTLELPAGVERTGDATGATCTGTTTVITCDVPDINPAVALRSARRGRGVAAVTVVGEVTVTVPLGPTADCRATATPGAGTARISSSALDLDPSNNVDASTIEVPANARQCPPPLAVTGQTGLARLVVAGYLGGSLALIGALVVVAAWLTRRRRAG